MTDLVRPDRIKILVNKLLDKGYDETVGAVLRAIARSATSGIIAQRLGELDQEVKRLVTEGKRLTPDNPVLRALLADYETVLRQNAAMIGGLSPELQARAAQAASQLTLQFAFGGSSPAKYGVQWNTPNPDAVAQVVDYTTMPTFRDRMAEYGSDILRTVQDIALNGFVMGQNPVTTARELRQAVEGLPAYRANSLMRTLQLTSYRDSSLLQRLANADILEYQVRIATLDDRTCMACVALHGTIMDINERVDDHDNGRCDSIAIVRGRQVDVQTGEDWFDGLPEDRQQQMMGPATFAAWQDGAISLKDFPAKRSDPVFGEQVYEASLKGMIGDQAKQYYRRKQ